MANSICIFEDDFQSRLSPLTLTRPVFDLRCGIFSLQEKMIRCFPQYAVHLLCREYLAKIVAAENPDSVVNQLPAESTEYCLFVNGRVLVDSEFRGRLNLGKEAIYTHGDTIVAAWLGRESRKKLRLNKHNIVDFEELGDVERAAIAADIVGYPWDLVNANSQQIETDYETLEEGNEILGSISEYAILLDSGRVGVGEGSNIKAGAVLDAEHGPISVGANVTIMSNAVIEGPAFIGDSSVIKVGAKIYGGTSIGEGCKVGGEVEQTIFHSFCNKQHDGFLGHAYVGQWVNLGADTNNSDLKNNYGRVKVFIDGRFVDSGCRFAGLFMGDHSKSGINTMFNTGTVAGTMSNIYGPGFPRANIPSFAWGGSDGFMEHDLERALETARIVMGRRETKMTAEYEEMMREVFVLTKAERETFGIKPSKA